MASYSKFLGLAVTVNYRVGDIMLPATGTFVGDSGRSIFLEQHIEQRGRVNYFRWEIPYQYIHRIVETDAASEEGEVTPSSPDPEAPQQLGEDSSTHSSALAAKAASGAKTA